MKTKDLLLYAGLAGLAYWLYTKSQNSIPTAQKRQALVGFINQGGDSAETKAKSAELFLTTMTDGEINAVYEFIFNYFKTGRKVPEGSALYNQIQAISAKYNIFT